MPISQFAWQLVISKNLEARMAVLDADISVAPENLKQSLTFAVISFREISFRTPTACTYAPSAPTRNLI